MPDAEQSRTSGQVPLWGMKEKLSSSQERSLPPPTTARRGKCLVLLWESWAGGALSRGGRRRGAEEREDEADQHSTSLWGSKSPFLRSHHGGRLKDLSVPR